MNQKLSFKTKNIFSNFYNKKAPEIYFSALYLLYVIYLIEPARPSSLSNGRYPPSSE